MTQNQVKEIIYSLQRYYPRAYEQVLSEAALFVCSFTLEPVLHSRFATWLAVIVRRAARDGLSAGDAQSLRLLCWNDRARARAGGHWDAPGPAPLPGAFPVMVVLGPLMVL
jgi:hypothetical protein